MSLVADYSDSNSSLESEDSDQIIEQKKRQEPEKSSLPSATSLLSKKSGEVFQNRYQKEEEEKKASLEKHVKMVDKDQHLKVKNGKKICWNYRKGRCRFGNKCQYAHDSDLATEVTNNERLTTATTTSELRDIKEGSNMAKDKKRKRPGLNDSLTPGKRVMKAFAEQRQKNS